MKTVTLTVFFVLALVSVSAQTQPAKLALKDIHGRSVTLSDYKGSVLLVNFWATWCAPCRTEIPDLIKLQRQYRNQGLRILGITCPPQKLSVVRRFARKLSMNYRIALGTKASKSLFTASETLPFTVVIDRKGIVRDLIEGIMYSDEFDQKVKPFLTSQGATALARSQRAEPHAPKIQRAMILVTAQGYRPSSVTLLRGIPAQLTFIRKVEATCGREIVIPDYGINRPLPLNTSVVVSITPNKSGRFKFTCGMNMFRGSVVVK
jgi:thiol-disulfide isomerase/thioredoxin